MASEKQLAANRLNSLKSTGPRTPEGKAIARLNAVQDGLTGQLTIIPREEYATWVAFSRRLTASLNPAGPQDLHIAARIVRDTWRLHRIAANEENIYTLDLVEKSPDLILTEAGTASNSSSARALAVAISNTRTFFNHPRDFERASLYEQRLKRGLHKDYALFRQLQRDRNLPATKSVARTGRLQPNPPAPVEPEPGYTMFQRHYPHSKETTSPSNGFVFPNDITDSLAVKLSPQVINRDSPPFQNWFAMDSKKFQAVVQDPYWHY